MSYVEAKPDESIDSLLKRFKKAVDQDGVLVEYKKRQSHEKPSVKRKRKKEAARKRYLKRVKKLERFQSFHCTGKNFKYSRDRTEKLPLPPPKKRYDQKNNENKGNRDRTD